MVKVLYPGHTYVLKNLDAKMAMDREQILQFVQRRPHHEPRPGTTNQEVCRALIERVKVLDSEAPWYGNDDILYNLRQVIYQHEIRAYHRHHDNITALGARRFVYDFVANCNRQGIEVEDIPVGEDGHWVYDGH